MHLSAIVFLPKFDKIETYLITLISEIYVAFFVLKEISVHFVNFPEG